RHRRAEARLDFARRRLVGERAGERRRRRGIGLCEHDFLVTLAHRDRGLVPVGRRQQHDGAGGARAEHCARRRRAEQRGDAPGARDHFALTTNSVPRTPSTASGVRTVIASGDALAMRPETTASVPWPSEASKRPLRVVGSYAYCDSFFKLSGTAERSESSVIVMPTEPSAPVFTTSAASRRVPTGAGSVAPWRSISTRPFE